MARTMELVAETDYLEEIVTVSRGKAMYDDLLVKAIQAARYAGISWERIAEVLGVSRQAVQQRYGPLMKPMKPLKRGPRKRDQWDGDDR